MEAMTSAPPGAAAQFHVRLLSIVLFQSSFFIHGLHNYIPKNCIKINGKKRG